MWCIASKKFSALNGSVIWALSIRSLRALLPIGVNEGTKIADIFLGGVKSYRAVMVLGIATDSQDATGKIIDERPVPVLTDDDLRRLEAKFFGAQTQVPPMFSALKKDGVRLYELARQGQEIERAPRSIQIDRARTPSYKRHRDRVRCYLFARHLRADIGC